MKNPFKKEEKMETLQRRIEIQRIDEQGRVILHIEFLNSKVSLRALIHARFDDRDEQEGAQVWSCGSNNLDVGFTSPEVALTWIQKLTDDVSRLCQDADNKLADYKKLESITEVPL